MVIDMATLKTLRVLWECISKHGTEHEKCSKRLFTLHLQQLQRMALRQLPRVKAVNSSGSPCYLKSRHFDGDLVGKSAVQNKSVKTCMGEMYELLHTIVLGNGTYDKCGLTDHTEHDKRDIWNENLKVVIYNVWSHWNRLRQLWRWHWVQCFMCFTCHWLVLEAIEEVEILKKCWKLCNVRKVWKRAFTADVAQIEDGKDFVAHARHMRLLEAWSHRQGRNVQCMLKHPKTHVKPKRVETCDCNEKVAKVSKHSFDTVAIIQLLNRNSWCQWRRVWRFTR